MTDLALPIETSIPKKGKPLVAICPTHGIERVLDRCGYYRCPVCRAEWGERTAAKYRARRIAHDSLDDVQGPIRDESDRIALRALSIWLELQAAGLKYEIERRARMDKANMRHLKWKRSQRIGGRS